MLNSEHPGTPKKAIESTCLPVHNAKCEDTASLSIFDKHFGLSVESWIFCILKFQAEAGFYSWAHLILLMNTDQRGNIEADDQNMRC